MKNYGLGRLWGVPTATYPKPMPFATLKDISLDVGGENDILRGEKFFGIAVAKKGGKVSGKIGCAQFDPTVLPQIVPGLTRNAGTAGLKMIVDEAATIPTTPFQVTVAQSATWSVDLGVLDTVTGLYMTRAASATGTGVYSVAAGVYTFNTADSGHAVKISYSYTVATASSTYTIDNITMTESTSFAMDIFQTGMRVVLPAVHIPKIGFGLKGEGWNEFSLEFDAVADANGKVAYFYFDEG